MRALDSWKKKCPFCPHCGYSIGLQRVVWGTLGALFEELLMGEMGIPTSGNGYTLEKKRVNPRQKLGIPVFFCVLRCVWVALIVLFVEDWCFVPLRW